MAREDHSEGHSRSSSPRLVQKKTLVIIGCLLVYLVSAIGTPVFFWVIRESPAAKEPCDASSAELLGNFTSYPDGSIVSDSGQEYPDGFHFTTGRKTRGCLCALKPCIRKCCAREREEWGFVFENDRPKLKCVNTSEETYFENFSLPIYSNPKNISNMTLDEFQILHGDFCSEGLFQLNSSERSYLLTDGRILVFGSDQVEYYFDTSMYCLDRINGSAQVETFVCSKTPEDKLTELQFVFNPYGMILSTPFLFLTLVVYALLPELHSNLHGQSLMCHMLCFLFGSVSLVIVQLNIVLSDLWCVCLGKSVGTRVSWRSQDERRSVYRH